MCKAFSCIVLKNREVVWRMELDSHEDLLRLRTGLKDNTNIPENMKFARCEYSPENGNYLKPNKWVFKLDESIKPIWFDKDCEMKVKKAWKEWKTQFDKILIKKPIVHPFKIKPPKITEEHIRLLREWDSVWASVRASVRDSVRASVGAYMGSFFNLPRSEWKYTEKINTKKYPFLPVVKLWEMGLVPSFDGNFWRLCGGIKSEILWQGEI